MPIRNIQSDPPDPFDDIVVGVVELGLEHLQVAHLEAGGRKRHLKVHRDRRPGTRHYVFLFPCDVFKPGPLFLCLCFQELDFG